MIKHREIEGGFDEVSVTNLIDVLFVLLVMFMITASSVVHSNIAIKLPEAYTKEKAQQAEIEIMVTRDGSIYVGNRKFNPSALERYLRRLAADKNTNKVLIKADGDTPYGVVMEVMDTARISGLTSLSLAVEEKIGRGR